MGEINGEETVEGNVFCRAATIMKILKIFEERRSETLFIRRRDVKMVLKIRRVGGAKILKYGIGNP